MERPHWVTPNQIAATLAELLGHRDWELLFISQGMKNPIPRIRIPDGFNAGWIEFENGEAVSRKGAVALKTVLQTLIERAGK